MGGNIVIGKSSNKIEDSIIKAKYNKSLEQDKPILIPFSVKTVKNAIEKLQWLDESLRETIFDEEKTKDLMSIKNIDLIEVLDATVYNVEITNKLCDVKDIIKTIKIGFDRLMCTQFPCDQKAIKCNKYDDDSQDELYCEFHSKSPFLASESMIELESELKKDIFTLESLEKLLIILQEQMKYLEVEKESFDKITFKKVKNQLDKEYDNLKSTLNEMTNKANQVITSEAKTDMILRYEPLSYIKIYSDKCVESISQILKFIFEANMKSEIELKLKTILNWSGILNQNKEEAKQSQVNPVQKEIYGKTLELCKIPTQTLK